MPQTRALYCVVQYMPDGSRAEAANAGVALFLPTKQWLKVRVSPTLERVRHFFKPGKAEFRRIQSSLKALESRLHLAEREFKEEGDLVQFVAARADAMRLTPPRLAMVEEPISHLDRLYEELVGDRVNLFGVDSKDKSKLSTALLPSLADEFHSFMRRQRQKRTENP